MRVVVPHHHLRKPYTHQWWGEALAALNRINLNEVDCSSRYDNRR
jgi:hypothetical protein